MKANRIWGLFPAALCLAALLSVSCQEKEPKDETVKATVSGTVVDDQENPLEGVKVTFVTADSKKEQKAATTTDAEGKYSVEVPSTGRVVSFEKDGYATFSTTIAEARFAAGAIKIDAELIFSQASIEGKVVDLESNPYEGVKVTCADKETTTDATGTYKFEGLTIKEYTLNFSDAEGNTAEVTVAAEDFEEGVAYLSTVTLGIEILPGLSYSKLAQAPKWYGNNYAGGNGTFKMGWSVVGFLTAYPSLNPAGRIAAEGHCLVHAYNNPEQICSCVYGRKTITSGNCYVNICARSFCPEATPGHIGIAVLDLTSGSRTLVYGEKYEIWQGLKRMQGGTSTLDVEHNLFVFDLSKFVGKEIAFALGAYGDKLEKETMIVRMLFSDHDMTSDFESKDLNATFTGDKPAGYENWDGFTKANLSSLMPNDGTSFTGQAGEATAGDYRTWKGTNHLMTSWSFEVKDNAVAPLQDNALFALCSNGKGTNYTTPKGYIFSRFTNPKKKMTIKARTYVTPQYTRFKVVVVDLSTYAVTCLAPTSDSVGNIASGDDLMEGLVGLDNDKGSINNPSDFATLNFDLSGFANKDVVIAIANIWGNNLSIYSVDFAD